MNLEPFPPPLPFDLPYSSDVLVTYLSYSIPVVTVCAVGVIVSVVLLIAGREPADDVELAVEVAPDPVPTVRSVRAARRLARSVEVVTHGKGDRRTARVRTAEAVATVLGDVPPPPPEMPADDEPKRVRS